MPAFYAFSVRKNKHLSTDEKKSQEANIDYDFDIEMKRFRKLLPEKEKRFEKKHSDNAADRWTKELPKMVAKRSQLQAARDAALKKRKEKKVDEINEI